MKRVSSSKQDKLYAIDVKILEGLALHGPRNISKLAAELDMPHTTLRRRINHLRSHFSLFLQGNIYHTRIGLRKVVVFVESKPGYEGLLFQCMKSNDYWLYVSQCVGAPKCLAMYGIPAGKEREFEEFLSKLEELDLICNARFFWSTCFQNINVTSAWFDEVSEEWVFPWVSWLEEVLTKKGKLPCTLKETDDYSQKADWIDIMILKELEKNCAIKLTDIAKMLGMSLQRVKYHFESHVVKEKMFEGPQILAEHYKGLSPGTYWFRFVFNNCENLTGFACSLMNKPFARAMGKAQGRNQLFVQVYLPRQELRSFIETLSKLVKTGFLDTYEYVVQDLAEAERQTISYEFFKDNGWLYDHEKCLKKLHSTVKQFLGAA
jgi:DNA-binding Lrp family transcriptional regulator